MGFRDLNCQRCFFALNSLAHCLLQIKKGEYVILNIKRDNQITPNKIVVIQQLVTNNHHRKENDKNAYVKKYL